jgi:Ca-activated chloride channel family protein
VGDEWQDRGPWLLLPLLLVVAMAFRRGWLLLLPLILLPHAAWSRRCYRLARPVAAPRSAGRAALRQGGPAKQAQQLARDPAWLGAADYRAADFAAAAKTLQQPLPGTNAAYNLGNALAKQGQYQRGDRCLRTGVETRSGQRRCSRE